MDDLVNVFVSEIPIELPGMGEPGEIYKDGYEDGRLAGLRQAAEIIERHYDHKEGIRLSHKAIRSRISSLSKEGE